MKKKITIISALAIIVSLSVALLLLTGAVSNNSGSIATVRVMALEAQDIESSVNLTGRVYSAQLTEVHSTLGFTIETVNVRVGDRVSAGDVLATLDASTLEMGIAQSRAALSSAQESASQGLNAAQQSLAAAQSSTQSSLDNAVLAANASVALAEQAVRAAEQAVESASLGVNAAFVEVGVANANLRLARRGLDDYDDNDDLIRVLRAESRRADMAVEIAQANLESSRTQLGNRRTDLERARETAQSSLAAARAANAQIITGHQSQVAGAQTAQNFEDALIAIEMMEADLAKATIIAPVSGTVTAIAAEAGAPGVGLLFVIQDTDNLVVKTNINEFDLASVNLGDMVNIRADAAGSAIFSGNLTRIAPTTTAAAYGSARGSHIAEFECEVTVTPGQSGLRIGMNTRLSILTQQGGNVFAVPAYTITTNQSGETIIFIAAPQGDGRYFAEAVTVNTGARAGRLVEVSADSLAEDALVIRNAEGIQSGLPITPTN